MPAITSILPPNEDSDYKLAPDTEEKHEELFQPAWIDPNQDLKLSKTSGISSLYQVTPDTIQKHRELFQIPSSEARSEERIEEPSLVVFQKFASIANDPSINQEFSQNERIASEGVKLMYAKLLRSPHGSDCFFMLFPNRVIRQMTWGEQGNINTDFELRRPNESEKELNIPLSPEGEAFFEITEAEYIAREKQRQPELLSSVLRQLRYDRPTKEILDEIDSLVRESTIH